jgi:hypothetical protein
MILGTNDAFAQVFETNNTERMRIDSTGNVGIGTITPTHGLDITNSTEAIIDTGSGHFAGNYAQTAAFTVLKPLAGGAPATSGTADSNVFTRFGSYGGGVTDFGMMATGDTWIQARYGTNFASNTNMLLNPNGGNVGIGNTLPGNKLEITHGTAGNSGLRFTNLLSTSATTTANGKMLTVNASGDVVLVDSGVATSLIFSGLRSATNTNTLDNTNFNQTWNWSTLTTQTGLALSANSITSGTLLDLTSSYAAGTSANGILRVANTGAVTTGTIFRAQSNSTAGSGLTVNANGRTGLGTATPAATLHNAGSTILGNLAVANLAAGGPIGTAAATVDIYTTFNLTQTTANQTVTIPSPTDTTAGRIAYINNTGTVGFTTLGVRIESGKSAQFIWNGTAWNYVGELAEQGTVYVVKPADQTVTLSTALVNDNDFVFNIGANETWVFRIDINGISPTAADWKFAVTAPAGATCDVSASDFEGATAQANLGCGVSSGLISGSGVDDPVWVTGTISTGATAGQVRLQWAQFGASGSTIVRLGSAMSAYRVRGADLAEVYFTQDGSIKEGDVVSLAGTGVSQVAKSAKVNDSKVLGIVSTKPGLVMGESDGKGKPVIVGLSGRVPVKVSTKNGAINPGDYITTSNIPGVGQKATTVGRVIGKALTGLPKTSEEDVVDIVVVFIENTYFDGVYEEESTSSTSTDLLSDMLSGKVNVNQVSMSKLLGSLIDINAATTTTSTTTVDGVEASTTTDTFAGMFWKNIKTQLTSWFADAANGIKEFFAKEIYTEKICVKKSDGTYKCVTGDELEGGTMMQQVPSVQTENLTTQDPVSGTSTTTATSTLPVEDISTSTEAVAPAADTTQTEVVSEPVSEPAPAGE